MSRQERAPLRIIAHNGASEWGGGEIALVDLLLGLESRGHRVTLFCNRRPVAEAARARGVETRLLGLGGDLAIHDALRLGLRLWRERPDAFIIGTFRKLWLGAAAARVARVSKVVVRIGLSTDTPRNFKYRFVLRRWVDHVVLIADAMRESYTRVLPELDRRLTTIYKGIPPMGPRHSQASARRALGLPEDVPLLGSVSRLVSQKRLDRLLDAMVFLHEDAHLAIAGEGPLRGALGQHARTLRLRHRVHFLGYQPNIAPLLDAVDTLVITSDREGMSGAMLQAMSRGVPVVSTDVSGAREALEPEANGGRPGLVTGFPPPQIGSALNSVLYDRSLLDEMGRAAEQCYQTRFGFERMLDGWEAVLYGPSPSLSPLPTARSTTRSI
jgi:glycosyltransferase involved in cell wall biosynthesis